MGRPPNHIVREELGPDIDFAVRDVILLAKALEHVKPMWLEDPVPPENAEAMARVTHAVDVPVCTGENLYTRHGFRKLIALQACDAVHIDIPKSGGLLESKRISDLADPLLHLDGGAQPGQSAGDHRVGPRGVHHALIPRSRAGEIYRLV